MEEQAKALLDGEAKAIVGELNAKHYRIVTPEGAVCQHCYTSSDERGVYPHPWPFLPGRAADLLERMKGAL